MTTGLDFVVSSLALVSPVSLVTGADKVLVADIGLEVIERDFVEVFLLTGLAMTDFEF